MIRRVQTSAQPADEPMRGRVVGRPPAAGIESLAEFLLKRMQAKAGPNLQLVETPGNAKIKRI